MSVGAFGRRVVSLPGRAILAMIRLYRDYISPMRPPSCRFMPTCSEYAMEAVSTRGAIVGSGLAIVRLLKCGPWHPGGYDPVPEGRTRHGSPEISVTDTALPDSPAPTDHRSC